MTTNIVILGVGLAGSACVTTLLSLTKKLNSVDITLVDVRSSSILKYAGTRAAALGDKFAHRACIPNSNLIPTTRGRVINKKVVSISPSTKEIVLEDGKKLNYDYLVCASGAVNVSPCEPPLSLRTVNAQLEYYNMISSEISRANWILILGSGAVGTELAGEIKSSFPDKTVAILSPGATLVDGCFPPPSQKFYTRLEELAKRIGIDLYLGQKAKGLRLEDFKGQPFLAGERTVETTSGQRVNTDLILLCTGKKLNNEIYPSQWLNPDGLVMVKNTLQLTTDENVFAIGDINDVEENKQGYFAQKQGRLVAKNIELLVRASNRNKNAALKPYVPSAKTQIIVPFGRKLGASFLGGIVLGSRFTSEIKGKDLFVKQHWTLYKQQKLLIKENEIGVMAKIESTYPAPGKVTVNPSATKQKLSLVPELDPNMTDFNISNTSVNTEQLDKFENQAEDEMAYDKIMESAETDMQNFSMKLGKMGFVGNNGEITESIMNVGSSNKLAKPQKQQQQQQQQQIKPIGVSQKGDRKGRSENLEREESENKLVSTNQFGTMKDGAKKKKKKKRKKNKDGKATDVMRQHEDKKVSEAN